MVDQTKPDKPANPQAEDSLREQFFSYIFHELRTPLTVIHSYAQILAAKLPGTPEFNSQRRISEQMINQGDEMVEMIEELLEASRIPLGRLNLDLAEINFQEFLENLVERLAETEGKDIAWQTPDQNLTVLADGPRLERAVRAVLTFVLQANESAEIRVELDETRSQVQLLMPLPNPLLSPEQAKVLFDLYRPILREQPFQLDIPKAGGLDIGLYVARGLVEGHKGTLVYSEELPGFIMTLPVSANV
jgi:K+-sensing histidine kinase KdpD